jgi:exodeoxyribonuclease-1
VLPVARHPVNTNGVVCCDLRQDPEPLLKLGAEEIHERLFSRAEDLPEGVERIPLKTVHINRCPILAPMKTLTAEAAGRWQIDDAVIARNAKRLKGVAGLGDKVQRVHAMAEFPPETDPDLMLYSGGFFSDADKREMLRLRGLAPEKLASERFVFEDSRLAEMLFRYRARNWPQTLTQAEREDWDTYRLERLSEPSAGASITVDDYRQRLIELRFEAAGAPNRLALLDELEGWAERVTSSPG